MSFCVSVFLFTPAHFKGLNTGTLPFVPVPSTERSVGLEHEDSLVTPDSLSLGNSIRLACLCLLVWPSSCLRGCFLKQNTDQFPLRNQVKERTLFCLIKLPSQGGVETMVNRCP